MPPFFVFPWPRLLSGELRVKMAEKLVENAAGV
jgi:hypothetical protein